MGRGANSAVASGSQLLFGRRQTGSGVSLPQSSKWYLSRSSQLVAPVPIDNRAWNDTYPEPAAGAWVLNSATLVNRDKSPHEWSWHVTIMPPIIEPEEYPPGEVAIWPEPLRFVTIESWGFQPLSQNGRMKFTYSGQDLDQALRAANESLVTTGGARQGLDDSKFFWHGSGLREFRRHHWHQAFINACR